MKDEHRFEVKPLLFCGDFRTGVLYFPFFFLFSPRRAADLSRNFCIRNAQIKSKQICNSFLKLPLFLGSLGIYLSQIVCVCLGERTEKQGEDSTVENLNSLICARKKDG